MFVKRTGRSNSEAEKLVAFIDWDFHEREAEMEIDLYGKFVVTIIGKRVNRVQLNC